MRLAFLEELLIALLASEIEMYAFHVPANSYVDARL